MEELGSYLLSFDQLPNNSSIHRLGRSLSEDAVQFRHAILRSVEACAVYGSEGAITFLPPYARDTFHPFANMTADKTASYSNFRFYPETLLADVLPRDVEGMLLDYHNEKGGRLAGASR